MHGQQNFQVKLDKFMWNPFKKPTALQLAKKTIEEYERLLMVAEDQAVLQQKLVEYYRTRISHLRGIPQCKLKNDRL